MKRLILISASLVIVSSAMAQTKCVTAPVNITGSQLTITSSGEKTMTSNKTYVYYSSKKHKRHLESNQIAGINQKYHSAPLMLNCDKQVNTMPETYNVSLTTPQSNVSVCPDSALNLTASINVEKISSYTGNYPNSSSDNNTYKMVSKRHYRMAARKMRKIKKNEERIARKTNSAVEVKSNKA